MKTKLIKNKSALLGLVIFFGVMTVFLWPVKEVCPKGPCISAPNDEGLVCYSVVWRAKLLPFITYTDTKECSK